MYNFRFDVGESVPPAGTPASNTGCSVTFLLNGSPVGYMSPVCGANANAPTSYGNCNVGSANSKTFYQTLGSFIQTKADSVYRFELVFNCTAAPTGGYNTQGEVDLFSLNPRCPNPSGPCI